ncbi:hypothetical protein F0U62_02895 [Cystobacter fuscus]|uniref:hypothetical protein n=1 Tax=Cystobacter fuscus TaxID=43 RepID=UPI002B2C9433|nr:hypothetical protein F0U62_02895 [Cystobacter fuscus]
MPSVVKRWRRPGLFLLGGLLWVYGPTGHAGDSVTNTCRQHPAYCTLLNGQEAGAAPTAQAGAKVASIAATLRFLSPELKLRIERTLHECAAWADAEVNRQRLGGNAPSRQQCQEVLPTLDPCGQKVTRAMQWGSEKHALATQCVQEQLDPLIPGRFSLEPRYRYDRPTGQVQWLSPAEVRALLRQDCGKELKGTLVPDVVIHSGNPLQAVSIYDFKFPCPPDNHASWTKYTAGHTNHGLNQGDVYVEALKTEAALVTPRQGVHQRIHP